jgi:HK97 family phage major capsid protein
MADTALERAQKAKAALSKPTPASTLIVNGAPAIRKGEDTMSSRPFRLVNLLGAQAGQILPENAQLEINLVSGFKKALEDTHMMPNAYSPNSLLYPGSRELLPDVAAYHKATGDILEACTASMADPDETLWTAKRLDKIMIQKGYEPRYEKTAQSYLSDNLGGSLVAPPVQGEVIPLMRNQSAVDRAGGRMVPLPPQGKWVAPRQTGPSTGYWIGENTDITESNVTTGSVSMQAKKLAALIRVPNELFKYASGATDTLLREDMAKTLALGYDYAVLYGAGGGNQPRGLASYTGTNEVLDYAATTTPAPAGIDTNGNTLQPQDGYRMAGYIEDRNFDLNSYKWIMRPRMWSAIASFRSDSVTTGDQAGVFVQALTRMLADPIKSKWCDYEVVRSSQLPNNLTKAGGTGLTQIWGGIWSELLLGMYGAIEFLASNMGDTSLIRDQTLIRAILHCDSVPRYSGAFVQYSSLIMG